MSDLLEKLTPIKMVIGDREGVFIDQAQFEEFAKAFNEAHENAERERLGRELNEIIDRKIAAGEIKVTQIECNEKGHLIIDKDEHPELYDWAVNG